MIYLNNVSSDYPHQLVVSIDDEKKFFQVVEQKFNIHMIVDLDPIKIDEDKFEYFFKIKEEILSWLNENIDNDYYSIEMNGKFVNINFKNVSDLILFKLACL